MCKPSTLLSACVVNMYARLVRHYDLDSYDLSEHHLLLYFELEQYFSLSKRYCNVQTVVTDCIVEKYVTTVW